MRWLIRYGRLDLTSFWTSADGRMIVSGFVNNVLDEVGVLQVLSVTAKKSISVRAAGTTLPRLMGIEFTVSMNAMKLSSRGIKKAAFGRLFYL